MATVQDSAIGGPDLRSAARAATTAQDCEQARVEKQEFVPKEASGRWRRRALVSLAVLAALAAQSVLTAGLVLAMVRAGSLGGAHVGRAGVLESASGKPVATAAAVEEHALKGGDPTADLTLTRAKSVRSFWVEHNGTWSTYRIASVHKLPDQKIHLVALDGTEIVVGRDRTTVSEPQSGHGGRSRQLGKVFYNSYGAGFGYHGYHQRLDSTVRPPQEER